MVEIVNKTNMRKSILYQIFILLSVLIAGCDENGDDGYYDNQYRVYFPKTSMSYNLAPNSSSVTKYTVKVPVQILGSGATEGMKVKVRVDLQKSTAEARLYTPIPEEIEFEKDSFMTYVPIELLRENISPDVDTTYQLTLVLEANEYFDLGVKEKLEAVVKFSNYLRQSSWWYNMREYVGKYNQVKYLKLMDIWGGEVTVEDVNMKMIKVIEAFKEMYEYFQEHPEPGVVFPDVIVWPYE